MHHVTDYVTLNQCWEVIQPTLPPDFKLNGLFYKTVDKKTNNLVSFHLRNRITFDLKNYQGGRNIYLKIGKFKLAFNLEG